MFNIGFGELLLIAVLGLLVFGPDRLPAAVRRATEMMGQLRGMAEQARQQVSDAAGIDQGEASKVIADLQELHPKRVAGSVLNPGTQAKTGEDSARRSTGVDPDLP